MGHAAFLQGAKCTHFHLVPLSASRLIWPQLLKGFTVASCASPDSTSTALLLSPQHLQWGLVATSSKHARQCASRKSRSAASLSFSSIEKVGTGHQHLKGVMFNCQSLNT